MNEQAVNKVLVMLCDRAGEAVILAAADKLAPSLGLAASEIPAVIAEARRRLTLAAAYNRDEELGKAIGRLNDLYAQARQAGEYAIAVSAQRELNRLMCLAIVPAPTPPGPADDAKPSGPARPPGSLGEIVAAIDEHLEPALPPDETATYADRIRQAGETIRTLRSQRPPAVSDQVTAKKQRRTTTTPRTLRQKRNDPT